MPPIDYMKVLDIAAITLDTLSHIEVNAIDLKLFNAVLSREDGSIIEIQLKLDEYDLELSLDKKFLDIKDFQNWINKFEFQLEQNFFKNIYLEQTVTKKEYKIKMKF